MARAKFYSARRARSFIITLSRARPLVAILFASLSLLLRDGPNKNFILGGGGVRVFILARAHFAACARVTFNFNFALHVPRDYPICSQLESGADNRNNKMRCYEMLILFQPESTAKCVLHYTLHTPQIVCFFIYLSALLFF